MFSGMCALRQPTSNFSFFKLPANHPGLTVKDTDSYGDSLVAEAGDYVVSWLDTEGDVRSEVLASDEFEEKYKVTSTTE